MMKGLRRFLAALFYLAAFVWKRYVVGALVLESLLTGLALLLALYVSFGSPGPPPWPL